MYADRFSSNRHVNQIIKEILKYTIESFGIYYNFDDLTIVLDEWSIYYSSDPPSGKIIFKDRTEIRFGLTNRTIDDVKYLIVHPFCFNTMNFIHKIVYNEKIDTTKKAKINYTSNIIDTNEYLNNNIKKFNNKINNITK